MINENSIEENIKIDSQYQGRHLYIDPYFFICILVVVVASILGKNHSTISSLIVIGMYSLLFFRPQYMVGTLIYMTIFDDYLLAFNSQSYSRYFVLIFVLSTLFITLANKDRISSHSRNILYVLFLAVFGVLLSWHGLYGYTSFPMVYLINILMLIGFMLCPIHNPAKLLQQIKTITVIAVVYLLYIMIKGNVSSMSAGQRFTVEADVNANQFAIGIAILTVIIVGCFLINNMNGKLPYGISLIIALISLFLTGSRSGLIAAVCSSVMILLLYLIVKANYKGKGLILIIALAGMLIGLYYYLQIRYPELMSRFTVQSISASGGTHRLAIWGAFLKNDFSTHWLLGIGFDPENMVSCTRKYLGMSYGAHNFIIDILARSGIIGLILYMKFFIGALKQFIKHYKYNDWQILSIGMLICTFANGIGENVLTGRFIWLALGLGFLLMNNVEEYNEVTK